MLQSTLLEKLKNIETRYQEIGQQLGDPEIIRDQNRYRELGREYANLKELVESFRLYQKNAQALQDAEEMLKESDDEMQALAEEESEQLTSELEKITDTIKILLLPKDPHDHRNVFLEIRAGAGGDEAAIFAGDLFRMYSRYAEEQKWQIEVLSANYAEQGGYKEIIARIIGEGAYSKFKYESGVHRVQRVPKTESQGRIHTSTCTVAILPEIDEVDAIDINPADLKVDTFRSSGAGGQHVNVTDSAVRITHLPTGVVVECQNERSQHQNRAKAMALLQSRILEAEQEKQRRAEAQNRKSQVGTGDRSERIRTYNFPQSRLTDHRVNLTLYNLPEIMEGKLEAVIEPLIREQRAALLAEAQED